ncbi:MAG: radical SAM protein [bacterium]
MIKPFVCGRFFNCYLIANRVGTGKASVISKNVYTTLLNLSRNNAGVPYQLLIFLKRLEYEVSNNTSLNDIMVVKEPAKMNFAMASYEITEKCNYDCSHCVMGNKSNPELSVEEKKKVVGIILESGCLMMRLTGGEPFLAEGFKEIYTIIHDAGIIVYLSTNGSFLSRFKHLFHNRPPARITVSFYGASSRSYELLTRRVGSFDCFIKEMEPLGKSGLHVRANIIITKYNKNEIERMVEFAKRLGFEYFIYSNLTPTFKGDSSPMDVSIQQCSLQKEIEMYNRKSIILKDNNGGWHGCLAGKASYHVGSSGIATICPTERSSGISLLTEELIGLKRLSGISDKLLVRPNQCDICEFNNECDTCPLNLNIFHQAGKIPLWVCKKQGI